MTSAAPSAASRRRAAAPAKGDPARGTIRAASRRLWIVALLLALVAHVPALPLDTTFLARLLLHSSNPHPAAPEPEPEETLIPVDLDLLAGAPRTEDTPVPPATAEPPPPPAEAPSSAAPSTAPAPAAAKPQAAKKADEIYDDLEKPTRATATLKDALAVAGGPGKIGPKDPNVQILFNGNRLRGNNAGAALGSVLTALPDWRSFFEGTKIDPVTDADQLLISGPQLRKSGGVFVWLHYRVPEADMKEAIDTIVKRSKGGKWLEDSPVPAAIGKAHNENRIFALIPGKKLLLILPTSAKDQLARAKNVRPFNASSKAGIVISLLTPRNAFADYLDVVDVPATYKWLRMVVTPLPGGGADVALEIGDASAEAAAKDAPALEKQLDHVRMLAKLATIIGADVLPPMKVEVDKDILRVNATITQKGLNHILNLARSHFEKRAEEDRKKNQDKKGEAPAASSSAAPSAPPAMTSAAPSAPLP